MIEATLALVIMIFIALLLLLVAAGLLYYRMGEVMDFLAAIAVKTGVTIEHLEDLRKLRLGRGMK